MLAKAGKRLTSVGIRGIFNQSWANMQVLRPLNQRYRTALVISMSIMWPVDMKRKLVWAESVYISLILSLL